MNRREDGFTLIEVLVALAILSVSLAVLLIAFSDSLDRFSRSRSELIAVSLANSLTDQIGITIPLKVGDQTGEFKGGYAWRLHISPYGSADDQKAWPISAYDITVTVSWTEVARRRSMSFRTLRLGAPRWAG